MPSRRCFDDKGEQVMAAVVIGVDPAKRSHTIEVIDGRERVLATERFDYTNTGYRAMRALARRWPKRVWAVEGALGVGRHLAERLVSDGERVLDVPVEAVDPGPGDGHRAWS
jgi:transposase